MRRDSGLSDGEYRVLLTLSEAEGKAMRSSQLAAQLEWERSRLSGQLGRMEKRGLLRREPSPEDARGSLVFLTDEGARAFRGSTLPHLAAIKEIFIDAFTPEQRQFGGRCSGTAHPFRNAGTLTAADTRQPYEGNEPMHPGIYAVIPVAQEAPGCIPLRRSTAPMRGTTRSAEPASSSSVPARPAFQPVTT
ncbi:MAG: MarR family transcriptional regulator [Arthrobacter sp.]